MSLPSLDPLKLRQSFDEHRASPDISIDEYVRQCQVELGTSVMRKRRIYLDKKFWILLRDAALHRSELHNSHLLLAQLRSEVSAQRGICPISESLFMELMKQSDLTTRRATAGLIDELSLGVTLIPYHQRVATEMAHFMHVQAGIAVYPLEVLMWSKLSYVLGVQHPTNEAYPPEEMLVIQKSFLDHMWECELVEIIDRMASATSPIDTFPSLANRLNEQNVIHANTIKSFSQAYAAEIRGSLSLFVNVAREAMESIATGGSGRAIGSTETEKLEHERQLLAHLCKVIKKQDVAAALRTLHIGALCHSAFRWDKQRKLSANDFFDFHHAEAALGYCNLFFTEMPLRNMLQQKHMKIDNVSSCKIAASLEEAQAMLSTD